MATEDADVFVVGYGQCTISRSLLDKIIATKPLTAGSHKENSGLKSLTIRMSDGGRLLPLIGHQLEELTISGGGEVENWRLEFSTLVTAVNACPNLRVLRTGGVHLEPSDDNERLPTARQCRHPLEVLSISLQLDRQSSGLRALSKWLVSLGVELCEFRLFARCREGSAYLPCMRAAYPAMQKMVRTCCRSCTTIHICSIAVEYFGALFHRRNGFPKLHTLEFEDAVWSNKTWLALLSALSSATRPLTRSLHTLAIRMFGFDPAYDPDVAAMLQANEWLVNFRFVTRGLRETQMTETNGKALKRHKVPFTIRHKSAFLSVLNKTMLPWESFVVANIFRFTMEYEVRRINISVPS